MSATLPTKAKRDANLQKLLNSVNAWGKREQQRLDNETKFLQAVLNGRNAHATGTANLAKASALLQSSIDDFINFGEVK